MDKSILLIIACFLCLLTLNSSVVATQSQSNETTEKTLTTDASTIVTDTEGDEEEDEPDCD